MWSKRRGQVFSTDFIISAFVFIILLNVAFMAWTEAYSQQHRLSQERLLQQQSSYLASLLSRTPGYPQDWNASTVKVLGLADPNHVIQETKLEELGAMTENEIQEAMNVAGSEFSINITNASGTMLIDGSRLEWGAVPTDADTVAVARRSVLVNATNLYQRGTLEVVLWR